MKKKTNSIIAVVIVIALCILAITFAQKISIPLIRTIVTITIIIATILFLIMGGILIFANKSGQKENGDCACGTDKKGLSPEQSESINKAFSQLSSIKMTIARIKNTSVVQSGNDACVSVDKVLRTLKDKPDKIQTSRQLFNYYLPTMEKVIAKYQHIETNNVDNADMPAKVTSYLNDVRSAMNNLYEGLFDKDKLNMEVDMEAMKLAIIRDGLLEESEI